MQASTALQSSLQGNAVAIRPPTGETSGSRSYLRVQAYKKGGGKPKGGYGGSEPNAKKKFCKVDASGQKNKGIGAYRFTSKYGDINDYSPIYDEYDWTPTGNSYALGTKGLTAWGGLLAAGLAVSIYLIVSTSQL